MKMSRKALSVLLLLALLVSSVLTGCGGNADALAQPDEVAEAMFKLVMQNDASAAQKALGYESEEAVKADFGLDGDFYGEMADEIIKQFEDALGATATEEDAKAFLTSFMNMMGKLQFSAEVKEQNDKDRTAVVTCTVSQLDMSAFNTAMESAVTEIMSGETSDPNALVSNIIRSMAAALDTMEPTDQTKSFDVDFELEVVETNGKPQKVWIPSDAGAFGEAISNAAMGN